MIQEFNIPAQFLNLNTVHLRIIVDTDGSVTYGSPQDNFEGVFLTDVSLVTPGTAVLWSDDLSTSTTFFHYAATPPASSFGGPFDDWGHIQRFGGRVDQTWVSKLSQPTIDRTCQRMEPFGQHGCHNMGLWIPGLILDAL